MYAKPFEPLVPLDALYQWVRKTLCICQARSKQNACIYADIHAELYTFECGRVHIELNTWIFNDFHMYMCMRVSYKGMIAFPMHLRIFRMTLACALVTYAAASPFFPFFWPWILSPFFTPPAAIAFAGTSARNKTHQTQTLSRTSQTIAFGILFPFAFSFHKFAHDAFFQKTTCSFEVSWQIQYIDPYLVELAGGTWKLPQRIFKAN